MRREFRVASKSSLHLLDVWRGMFCGIVSRIRGALSAELVIFLLGVMGNHYGAIWYGFEFPLLPPLRKGLPPLSIRHRSSQTKRLMMVLGNQSLMPRTSGRLQKLNVGRLQIHPGQFFTSSFYLVSWRERLSEMVTPIKTIKCNERAN